MKKLLVTTICLLGAHLLSAGEIWISPQGNDFNDGTRPSPKATLTSALRQAREWRRTDDERGRGGITICMEGGTYALYEPVFIRPEDSGTEDSPTVIRPVADEKVVLSGGIRIGGWKKQGKLWVADVPMFNGRPLDFRQLWVNGKKAVRARDVEDFEKMNRICSVDEKNEILYVPAVAIRRLVDGKGALKATHWELLLVEDCGPDRSREIIEQYIQRTGDTRIRMLTFSTNLGAARARNLGVNEAKGRYLAYLDADDLWTPDKLEKELAFLKEKQAAFVFTGYEFADENGKGTGKIVRVPATITYKEALKNTTIFTSTVMFDMEQLSKEQLQMPQIKSEDTALWWRILREGYVACGLDQNLVKYRRAGKSLSSNKLEALRRIWNLYRKAEGMSVPNSAWHFCFWAVRAVKRRV